MRIAENQCCKEEQKSADYTSLQEPAVEHDCQESQEFREAAALRSEDGMVASRVETTTT